MNLKDKLKVAGISLLGIMGISWVLGGEPIIMRAPLEQRVEDFTFNEYCQKAYNNKSLNFVAYPGAKLGRLIHNSYCD